MDAQLREWKDGGQYFDFLGFEVFYRVAGSGPYLLLIHGYPFNSWDWEPLWDRLTAQFTVIAPDMIGMGFSAKPDEYDYSVLAHADMHEALLAELGVSRCHVVAHDLGVSVAQEMLARHDGSTQSAEPFRIDSLTWLNGGLFIEAYRPRLVQQILSTPVGDVAGRFHKVLLSKPMLARSIDEMFGPATKPSPQLLEQFDQIMNYNDGARVTHKVGRFVRDRLTYRNRWVRAMRTTAVPMRLINGPADPNSGRHMAERYREVIPGPDVVMLPDAIAHWPHIEAPDAVLEAALDHIERASGASAHGEHTGYPADDEHQQQDHPHR
ncbi:alpha/beta fold hydrolase [Nocardia cyriacigeorgica]|uniref:Alpha/beta hydrolase n=1 Tax=Nocardia cyriacigeorgica TaxID=135487 RepID=A0A6P1D9K2_9NOCA|nr:alpha/beta hydrolase [Nocardia cyriacigeorgica]NEW44962.1 alpha/beta hydrolase [Nocardia cyriacigeorgica]